MPRLFVADAIWPRNSSFGFENRGENIPRNFRSCSRVLNAVVLSFSMWFPLVGLAAVYCSTVTGAKPLFHLFQHKNTTAPLILLGAADFRGQKPGIIQNAYWSSPTAILHGHADSRDEPCVTSDHETLPVFSDGILPRCRAVWDLYDSQNASQSRIERARVMHQTRQAPAAFSVRAHSESVAPVVITSSTTRTVRPRMSSGCRTAKVFFAFSRRSRSERSLCRLGCPTRRRMSAR